MLLLKNARLSSSLIWGRLPKLRRTSLSVDLQSARRKRRPCPRPATSRPATSERWHMLQVVCMGVEFASCVSCVDATASVLYKNPSEPRELRKRISETKKNSQNAADIDQYLTSLTANSRGRLADIWRTSVESTKTTLHSQAKTRKTADSFLTNSSPTGQHQETRGFLTSSG